MTILISLVNPPAVVSLSSIRLNGLASVVFNPDNTEKSVLIVSVSIPNKDLPKTLFS
jgi:hypothetical protein